MPVEDQEDTMDLPKRWTVPRETLQAIGEAVTNIRLMMGSLTAEFAGIKAQFRSHGDSIDRMEGRLQKLEVYKEVNEAQKSQTNHLFTVAVTILGAVSGAVAMFAALKGLTH